jgi:hypothetical protein
VTLLSQARQRHAFFRLELAVFSSRHSRTLQAARCCTSDLRPPGDSGMAGAFGAMAGGAGAALGKIGLSAVKSAIATGFVGLLQGLQYNALSGAVAEGCTCPK